MTGQIMSAKQAAEFVESAAVDGIGMWIVGGWGIDALLADETRVHHDLDVLVRVCDLPALDSLLRRQGFARAFEWEENAPVRVDGRAWDTAFVERHPDGREIDVHAVEVDGLRVTLSTKDPWVLPSGSLDGVGRICGRAVPCVTAQAQRAMHRGYELPPKHREDLRRLDGR